MKVFGYEITICKDVNRKPVSDEIDKWVSIKNPPTKDGWYMVKYIEGKPFNMYFRTYKISYSDSQWYVNEPCRHCWKGILPDVWLMVNSY